MRVIKRDDFSNNKKILKKSFQSKLRSLRTWALATRLYRELKNIQHESRATATTSALLRFHGIFVRIIVDSGYYRTQRRC